MRAESPTDRIRLPERLATISVFCCPGKRLLLLCLLLGVLGAACGKSYTFVVRSPQTGTLVERESVTVSGTGKPGETVTVLPQGGTAIVDQSETWAMNVRLRLGENELTFRHEDFDDKAVTIRYERPFAIASPARDTLVRENRLVLRGTGKRATQVRAAPGGETTSVDRQGAWTLEVGLIVGVNKLTLSQAGAPDKKLAVTYEPPFEITSHPSDSQVREEVLLVRGTGKPGAQVKIAPGDATATVDPKGVWGHKVTLAAGQNTLTFTQAGSPNQVMAVTYEPRFEIIAPGPGSMVGTSDLVVRGTGRPGAEITQDISWQTDLHTNVDPSGRWAMTVRLTEGANTLKFRQELSDEPYKTLEVNYDPAFAPTPMPAAPVTPTAGPAEVADVPTNTPTPSPTNTPTSEPTDTPRPPPTDTPIPSPTPRPTFTLTPIPAPTEVRRPASPRVGPGGQAYAVLDVADGDTVKIERNGTVENLRLIGIDTPETVDPRKPIQCYGPEASSRAKALLEGERVRLAHDPTQDTRDRYGRLLVYLWRVDGLFLNYRMIADGYAKEYTYDAPYQYQAQFRAAERQAMQSGKGLWSPTTCGGDTAQAAGGTVTRYVDAADQGYTGANLRSQPTSDSALLRLIPNGESVRAEDVPLAGAGGSWTRVTYAGQRGYVLGSLLSDRPPRQEPQLVEPPVRDCDPSYPDSCIPPYPPDLDCDDVDESDFTVRQPDPHGFDGDEDGVGCESESAASAPRYEEPAATPTPTPRPASTGPAVRISLSCFTNPERTTVTNNSGSTVTITSVSSLFDPEGSESFSVHGALSPGESVTYQSDYNAGSNVLTSDYIYSDSYSLRDDEGARVVTSEGTFEAKCV